MSFESLDNFLINLSFQGNWEILLKKRKEVNDQDKSKLSRNFLLTIIICQVLLLDTDTSDTHMDKNENSDFQKYSKKHNAEQNLQCSGKDIL